MWPRPGAKSPKRLQHRTACKTAGSPGESSTMRAICRAFDTQHRNNRHHGSLQGWNEAGRKRAIRFATAPPGQRRNERSLSPTSNVEQPTPTPHPSTVRPRPRRRTGSPGRKPNSCLPASASVLCRAPRQGFADAALRPPLTRHSAPNQRWTVWRDCVQRSWSDQRQAIARGPRRTGNGNVPSAIQR